MTTRQEKAVSDRGSSAEEALRSYFISIGYFVVRGVPIAVGDDDITDIDLWMYNRHTAITRERVNVDIKNKQRSKAAERILVARGIKEAFGLDRSVVVTPDQRDAIVAFGARAGVTVFGGEILQPLIARHGESPTRLSEEALVALLDDRGMGKLTGNWTDRLRRSKRLLVSSLGFDACNELLDTLPGYIEVALTNLHRREAALRLAYLTVAMFLVSLDYALAASLDGGERRRQRLLEGLQFGSEGAARTQRVIAQASQLASAVTNTPAVQFRAAVAARVDIDEARFSGIAEYFVKGQPTRNLVEMARTFEGLAYGAPLVQPAVAPTDARAILGLLADALGLNRKALLE